MLLDENDIAVLESTGNLWVRIYDLLRDRGVRVKLANLLKTRAIASARIKSEIVDIKRFKSYKNWFHMLYFSCFISVFIDLSKYNEELVRRGEAVFDLDFLRDYKNELKRMNMGKVGRRFRCNNIR